MICRGCEQDFQGNAAYCPRCEMKQLMDSTSPSPSPMAPRTSGKDFDQLYYTPKRLSQREQASSENKTPLFGLWFSTLLITSAAISRISFGKFDIFYGIGYTIGLLGFALIIAGIRRIFTRKGFGKAFLISWAVVAVLSLAGSLMPSRNDQVAHSRQQALKHLADVASGVAPSSSSTSSAAPANQAYLEPDGDALTNVVNQLTANLSRYNRHITELNNQQQALGLESVLAPRNLVTRAGIQHGRETIAAYGRLLDDYQSSFSDYENNVMQIIATAPPASRERMTAGFQQNLSHTRGAVSNFIGVEHQLMTTITAVLDLAQANLGASRAQGNVIYLPQHALLEYQHDIATLHTEAAQEADASEQLANIRRVAISQLTSASQVAANR